MTTKEMIQLALKVRGNSYSPYSGYAVGACLLTASGTVFTGCNIENAAFSPTNCAERSAIFSAVSQGERKIEMIVVVGGPKEQQAPLSDYAAPCGVCRQVLWEFGDKNTRVILAKSQDEYVEYPLGALLPLGFSL